MAKKNFKGKARTGAKRLGNMIGISSSGLRAGKITTTAGLAMLAWMPCVNDTFGGVTKRLSMMDVAMGAGNYGTTSLGFRAQRCMEIAGVLLLGKRPAGSAASDYTNDKLCGVLIASGITMTLVGNYVNGLLKGSFVKL